MTRSRPRVALAGILLALAAAPAAAQEGCTFIEGSGNLQRIDFGGGPITYVQTPNLSCRDGVRIRADSAVAYESSNYVQLIGRVRFEDAERRLTARSAEYFTTVGRLQAHLDAELVQKGDSSIVRGDEMIYNREGPDRERAQLEVFGDRPTARLYVRSAPDSTATPDSAAAGPTAPRVPYDIEADRILIEGDSYFRARGTVAIEREDLRAFADSVEYDQLAGALRLWSNARMVVNERELSAQDIVARLADDDVEEVEARRDAVLVSEDIRLKAPLVRVFFAAGAMERLVATPMAAPAAAGPAEPTGELPPPAPELSEADRARPEATAEEFRIVADSLDVLSPGEVLDRIHAAGRARAESSSRDSLNLPETPQLARTDWMEGDTIVATFAVDTAAAPADSAAAPDSARGAPAPDSARADYRLERLSATGNARSLYRMPPEDSARARGDRRPAIHYVTAQAIVLEMTDGEMSHMEVFGRTEGVHASPSGVVPDSAAAPAVPPVPVDTVSAAGRDASAPPAPGRPTPARANGELALTEPGFGRRR